MKTLREFIDQLDEISRRDFLKVAGAAASLAAVSKSGAQSYHQDTINSTYKDKVRDCVRPGVPFRLPSKKGAENLTVQYRISITNNGIADDISLIKSSGNSNFDQAIKTGIRRCQPLPKMDNGKYPPSLDIVFKLFPDFIDGIPYPEYLDK